MSDERHGESVGSDPEGPGAWEISEEFRGRLLRGENPDPTRMAGDDQALAADLALIRTLYGMGRDVCREAQDGDEYPVTRPLNDRYVLTRKLGAGGMGVVYEADDIELERRVAVKLLRNTSSADERELQRILREPKLHARLKHPHVVTVHDVGSRNDGVPFLVMELIEGGSAEAFVDGRRPREWRLVTEAVRDACRGLEAVHAADLLHRDIKPANILLDGANGAKLADFGLAKATKTDGPSLSSSNEVEGTLAYMSPEQLGGRTDRRSDIYSLGAAYRAMLTGRVATPGAERDIQGIPPECVTVVRQATDPNPDRRYQTAGEMREALDSLLQAAPLGRAGVRDRWGGWLGPAVCSLLILLVLTGGLVTAILWLHASANPPSASTTPTERNGTTAPVATSRLGVGIHAERLLVRKLEVTHWARHDTDMDQDKGAVGRQSFSTRLNDSVTIAAELSASAYCYLIAFRPDGVDDVCFPEKDNVPPALTDRPCYPPLSADRQNDPHADRTGKSKRPKESFALEEGTGLMAVFLVASRRALPAYTDWRKSRTPCPWHRTSADANLVWRYDGVELVDFSPDHPNGQRANERAKGRELRGEEAMNRLVAWLRQIPDVEAIEGLGFPVLAR